LCRNRAQWLSFTALAIVGAIGAASCTTPRGWLNVQKPDALAWSDDGETDSLVAALDQSRVYFQRVPPATPYRYGDQVYTAAELSRSHLLFGKLLQANLAPEAFSAALARQFNVYESVSESSDNLFTGYYEPVIPGSETPGGSLTTPLYARPADLVEIQLDRFDKNLPARKLMGRVDKGTVVPYYSRGDIQLRDAVKGVARPIVYVDEVDLFFLQIQGSGRVQLPDGRILRVGYDGSNGHPYRSLGAEMIRRELLQREEVTLQSIRGYLAGHPEAVKTLLNTNPSYVFFRELDGTAGPLGNLGVPLTPGRSLAADQRLVPAGAIAYVLTDVPVLDDPKATQPLRRFMLVQDIGGAIRGHGRGDLFWGLGPLAEWRAGHSKQSGRLLVLVAKKEFLAPGVNTADAK
jgi:membrane-bound lytic murein transglycosylase A